jgi:hypothetical protein
MKAVSANAATKKGQSSLPATKEPPKMMRLFALLYHLENDCIATLEKQDTNEVGECGSLVYSYSAVM